MIKKSLKKFKFLKSFTLVNVDEPIIVNVGGEGFVLGFDPAVGGVNWVEPPNNWTVHLGMDNIPEPQLVLDANGDARFTGRVHALGSVIWNQELNRLEFWDGENWQPIHI